MEIIGIENENYLIEVNLKNEIKIINRNYNDIYLLSKLFSLQIQFPSTSFKKLLIKNNNSNNNFNNNSNNWNIKENNYNLNIIKSLNIVNNYFKKIIDLNYNEIEIFCENDLYEIKRNERKRKKENEKYSRDLQQYFMSNENVNQIITILLSYFNNQHKSTLFIEPSCGDGRLLEALLSSSLFQKLSPSSLSTLSTLSTTSIMNNHTYLIGCDIDPIIGKIAKEKITPYSNNSQVLISNFLDLSRNNLISSEVISPSSDIIVFGNPPYTTGGGTGNIVENGNPSEDTGRDLPHQFIVHSIVHLNASLIIFMLPTRCSNELFIERCKSEIKRQTLIDSNIDNWIVSQITPINNEFDFCNRVIRQPVIIQIWERKEIIEQNQTIVGEVSVNEEVKI